MEDDFNDFSELSAGETSIALRRCFAQVAAERDQLRAEVDRLRPCRFCRETGGGEGLCTCGETWGSLTAKLTTATARAEAAEALVAWLRGALDDAGDVVHACVCETEEIRGKVCHSSCIAINAALTITPASAGNRIKAEAYREAARLVDSCSAETLHREADRMEKEGANGR